MESSLIVLSHSFVSRKDVKIREIHTVCGSILPKESRECQESVKRVSREFNSCVYCATIVRLYVVSRDYTLKIDMEKHKEMPVYPIAPDSCTFVRGTSRHFEALRT